MSDFSSSTPSLAAVPSLRLRVGVAAAVLALSGAAWAQTPPAAPEPGRPAAAERAPRAEGAPRHERFMHHGPHARGEHGWHGQRMGQMGPQGRHFKRELALRVPGYGGLGLSAVDALGLTPAQQALVVEARQADREIRQQWRERGQQARKERQQSPSPEAAKIDPQAALARATERRQQFMALRDKADQAWLKVWNALDDKQREQAGKDLAKHKPRHGGGPR